MLLEISRKVLPSSQSLLILCRSCSSNNLVEGAETSASLPEYRKKDQRLLKVAVIGTPNSGKSTFINNLMDRKVCATSSKVHTTRGKSMAIFTADNAQIVFVDTPGLVSERECKRFNLTKSFLQDSMSVLNNADIVGVLHDVTNIWTRERLDIKVIKSLEMNRNIPSFLVLNKVDALKSKRKLLDITRQITVNYLDGKPMPSKTELKKHGGNVNRGWPYFKDIFMVSALTGNGLETVKDYLIKESKPGKWMFPHKVWTDQSAEKIITNTVQAKFLDFLPQEIPYLLKPGVEYLDINDSGTITTVVTVNCPTARIAKLVAGAAGGKLKQITEGVQQDLQDAFQNFVKLKIILEPLNG